MMDKGYGKAGNGNDNDHNIQDIAVRLGNAGANWHFPSLLSETCKESFSINDMATTNKKMLGGWGGMNQGMDKWNDLRWDCAVPGQTGIFLVWHQNKQRKILYE